MSSLAHALLAELDDDALDRLAELLAPRIARLRDGDGWLRGAGEIAEHLHCPRSRVYALVESGQLPVHRDGKSLCARRHELDAWVRSGGGRRE